MSAQETTPFQDWVEQQVELGRTRARERGDKFTITDFSTEFAGKPNWISTIRSGVVPGEAVLRRMADYSGRPFAELMELSGRSADGLARTDVLPYTSDHEFPPDVTEIAVLLNEADPAFRAAIRRLIKDMMEGRRTSADDMNQPT